MWNSEVTYLENLGAHGDNVLVQQRNNVAHVVTPTGIASQLNGYGSPCWAALNSNLAVILRADGAGVDLIDVAGVAINSYALPDTVAAGYLRHCGDGFIVVLDYGPALGRTIVKYQLDGSSTQIYATRNLLGDLVVSPSGNLLAWLEWPASTMPWESAQLAVCEYSSDLHPRFVNGVESAMSGPFFVDENLYCALEDGEWTTPMRLSGPALHEITALDAPRGEYRSDWCFGRPWTAGLDDGVLMCSVYESTAQVAWLRDSTAVTVVADSPPYIYEIVSHPLGAVALVSTSQENCALWLFREFEGTWSALSTEEPAPRRSSVPLHRRTSDGVPFIWRRADNNGQNSRPGVAPGVVVTAHGGPTAYASMGYDANLDLMSQRGLAVASVNYRGSSSYGRTYRRSLDGHWAQSDVDDLISVIEYLVSTGEVDDQRVFVRGTSAGALSALLASCSEHVSGVVALSSVTDLRFLAENTLEFESSYVASLLGAAMNDDDLYLRRSPFGHIDEMGPRALLIHGEHDDISPIEPIRRLAETWSERSPHVELMVLSGEGHSFRDPDNQRRALTAELAFYENVRKPV
jgi:dipeptidyl aminopeptidase/acylaminoacyl peptidase